MKITTEDVAKTTSRMLEMLVSSKIINSKDLEYFVGKSLSSTGAFEDFVKVESKPWQDDSTTFTLKYFNPKDAEPVLQIKINEKLNYTVFILKAQERLEGYEDFAFDDEHNLTQSKKLNTAEFEKIRTELYNVRNRYSHK